MTFKLRLLLALIILIGVCKCRPKPFKDDPSTLLDNYYYSNFSIAHTSSDVLRLLTNDLATQYRYSEINGRLEQDIAECRETISNPEFVSKYLNAFQVALEKAQTTTSNFRNYYEIAAMLDGSNLPVYTNYSYKQLSRGINGFIPSIIQTAALGVIDSLCVEVLGTELKNEAKTFIQDRVDCLYTKNIDILNKNKSEFIKIFAAKNNAISPIRIDSVVGRCIPEYAYQYIQQQIASDGNWKASKLSTTEYRQKLTALDKTFNKLEKKAGAITRDRIDSISKSFGNLIENQKEVFSVLDDLTGQANKLNLQLDSILSEIEKASRLPIMAGKIDELKTTYYKYSKAFQLTIELVNDYKNGTLNVERFAKKIENKYVKGILQINNSYNEITSALGKLKDPDFSTVLSVATDVCNNLEASSKSLENLGLLKNKDAKNVAKFLKYLTSTIQIGTGITKMFSGDPSGVMNVLSGLSGIFGRKNPSNTPEMGLMKYMESRFDNIDARLSQIDQKLDTLTNITIGLYKDMMQSFENVYNILRATNERLITIQDIVTEILRGDYRFCHDAYLIAIDNNFEYKTFQNYTDHYNSSQECLRGLNRFLTADNQLFFQYKVSAGPSGNRNYDDYSTNYIDKVYDPLIRLFEDQVPGERIKEYAICSLLFPQLNYTYGTVSPFSRIREAKREDQHILEQKFIDEALVRGNYINYEFLDRFSEIFLKFSTYFEIKGDVDFKPLSLGDYLKLSPEAKKDRNSVLQRKLINLGDLTNKALVQQSLLSGNFILNYIGSSVKSEDTNVSKLAFTAMKYNAMLTQNYIKKTFRNEVLIKGKDSSFYKRYVDIFLSTVTGSPKRKDVPSSLVKQFNLEVQAKTGMSDFFKLRYEPSSNQLLFDVFANKFPHDSVTIKALEPDFFLDDKMLQGAGVHKMLALQEKVRLRLMDLTFVNYLLKADPTIDERVVKTLYRPDNYKVARQ
ncbi:hypothetical protein EXU57_24415 [Segetibacter sp. 3557_3]|uniref:hypothetical protein n=1 Tax=Segetibacter sp. 3557_3 TaxID=2547429 RepID=UPI0010588D67|nr:hypothetical protein [Segetibacter sp. 3557_3]TDH18068.1 hypothetical protein EXU57_24415 [Segetibacter sp. 3557_3]